MCRVLAVSTSGYYKWRKQSEVKKKPQEALEDIIRYEYERSRNTYGSPRIALNLNKGNFVCSKSTIARWMKRMNIFARRKKRFKHTTNSNHDYGIFNNLLNREFNIETPGRLWVSDITYIRVSNYWIYLTVIIDLADRMVLGWSLSKDMSAEHTVIKTFNEACKFRKPASGFTFHSDRGVQYACNDFAKLITKNKGIQSMSRKGNCWDNAVAESFFKTLKVECIYKQNINNFNQAYGLVFNYINGWYNTQRIHSALGGLTPLETYINKAA